LIVVIENVIVTSNDNTVHFDDLYPFSEVWFHAASAVTQIYRLEYILASFSTKLFVWGGKKKTFKIALLTGSPSMTQSRMSTVFFLFGL
jgi:hypothetical protein